MAKIWLYVIGMTIGGGLLLGWSLSISWWQLILLMVAIAAIASAVNMYWWIVLKR